MRVYLYGMKDRARDDKNYFMVGYVRDLYLEEMTADLRDEFYNVLCYENKLNDYFVGLYDYEFIGVKEIGDHEQEAKEEDAK